MTPESLPRSRAPQAKAQASLAAEATRMGATTDFAQKAPPVAGRWPWLLHWEFWLVMALAATLRLWHIDAASEFLGDQAGYVSLARDALTHHALLVTGLPYSIGLASPPVPIYLMMPFLLSGTDPLPLVVSFALWNALGVAVTYIFAYRYFGRGLALVAAILFATSIEALHYSVFIWSPNYLPTLVALWALFAFGVCVAGKRAYIIPTILVLTVLVAIHIIQVLLVLVTVIAFFMAAIAPRRRDYVAAAVAAAATMLPIGLWLIVSKFADLRALKHLVGQHSVIDGQVFSALLQLGGATTYSGLVSDSGLAYVTPDSLLAHFGTWHLILELCPIVLFFLGYAILTLRVFLPAMRLWAHGSHEARRLETLRVRARAQLGRLRADSTARLHAVLWLWVTLPPLTMIRHSSPVYMHFLSGIYPAVFVVAGIGAKGLFDGWTYLVRAGAGGRARQGMRAVRAAGLAALVVGLIGLVAGQSLRWIAYADALAAGQYRADYGFGYTLSDMQAADHQLTMIQQQEHASHVYISVPSAYLRAGLEYVLSREHPDRTSFYGDCLVLPAPGAQPALVVTTQQSGAPYDLLQSLPESQRLADINMPGGEPFAVYNLRAPVPLQPGEQPVPPGVFEGPHGALQLDAIAVASDTVRLRWTALASPPAGGVPQWYRVQMHAFDDQASGTAVFTASDCEPTQWQAGETIFTWMPLVPSSQSGAAHGEHLIHRGPVTVEVYSYSSYPWMPSLGPLRLMTYRFVGDPLAELSLHGAPAWSTSSAGGSVSPSAYALPLASALLDDPPQP